MTTSQFMEQVNYVSALEQDLGQSISAIATVEVCESSFGTTEAKCFRRERTPPKASVVVTPIQTELLQQLRSMQ